MLGSKIDSPVDFILELQFLLFVFDVSLKDFDSFSVGNSVESCVNNMLKSSFKSFLNVLFKEIHVIFIVLHNVLEAEFDVIFGTSHIVFHSCKNDLWFDHPEFTKMSSGVRVFSSESWSEGVAI